MNQLVNLDGDDLAADPALAAAPTVISAEIDLQIATAKRYPRQLQKFRTSLQAQATIDESIARQCHYAIPRDGKTIEGPSIRFAEMVLQAWGNARAATRVVAETDNFVVAQGVFFDLENNVAIAEDVQRRITDKKGVRFGTDMVGVTGAAARSIALRNAIFRGVPKALWWDAYLAARRTIVGDIKTMKQKRQDALAFFKTLGIVEAQVFAALGIAGLADLGPNQLVTLAGFRTSIEDEGKDPEHIFPPAETKATARPKPPQPAQPNPDGAPSPGPVTPTQGQASEAPSGTQPPPAAIPERKSGAASDKPPAPHVAPYVFASPEAALAWAGDYRAQLEAAESPSAISKLKAANRAQLDAYAEIDPDRAQGLVALAYELSEALAEGASR